MFIVLSGREGEYRREVNTYNKRCNKINVTPVHYLTYRCVSNTHLDLFRALTRERENVAYK